VESSCERSNEVSVSLKFEELLSQLGTSSVSRNALPYLVCMASQLGRHTYHVTFHLVLDVSLLLYGYYCVLFMCICIVVAYRISIWC
jgi:hypothetical protein